MKKIIVICLAVIMVLGSSFSVFAETLQDNPAGDTVEKINSTDTMNNNAGTVTYNAGTIENNKPTGIVTTNNGIIENNAGKITENASKAPIQINSGTIEGNGGTVENNTLTGVVTLEEYGEVENNHGTVNNAALDESGKLVYSAGGSIYYGVTYKDGETELSNESVIAGSSLTIQSGTTKSGYNFVKWTVMTPSGLQTYTYTGGESVDIENPMWLEAVWEQVQQAQSSGSTGTFTEYPSELGSKDNPFTGGEWKEEDGKWHYIYQGSKLIYTVAWIKYTDKDGKEILGCYYFDKSGVMVTDKTVTVSQGNTFYFGNDGRWNAETDSVETKLFVPDSVTKIGEAFQNTQKQMSVITPQTDSSKYATLPVDANIDESLKNAYVESLNTEMMTKYNTQLSADNCAIYDISEAALQTSGTNNGKNKKTVNITYPTGSRPGENDYIAVQMQENGEIEKVDTFLTNKGIQIEVETLKPIGVAWQNK